MYNVEHFKELITKDFGPGDLQKIDSLINDVDEYNQKLTGPESALEIFIDFYKTDKEDDEQWPPNNTFSVKVKLKNQPPTNEVICSGLTLEELDTTMCGITECQYESQNLLKELKSKVEKQNDLILERITEYQKDENLIFQNFEGCLVMSPLNKFTNQLIDGQLYDINRLPEVISMFRNSDIPFYQQKWINDLALVQLLKFYYNKCMELENKNAKLENDLIKKEILK